MGESRLFLINTPTNQVYLLEEVSMTITAYGAAGEVTGSNYYIEDEGVRFLVDLGLFQGNVQIEKKNRLPLPYNPADLNFVLLTHAHIDHSGRLPLLRDFNGTIYMTRDTHRLVEPLLKDSASIHEKSSAPLYTADDVAQILSRIQPVDFFDEIVDSGVRFRFHPNGHLLGSAFVHVETPTKSLVFSGDMGRYDTILYPDPAPMPYCDALITESTYATSRHEPMEEAYSDLLSRLLWNFENDRTVVIPAFAMGRSAELLYGLRTMAMKEKKLGEFYRMPIYMDSPLAIKGLGMYTSGYSLLKHDYNPDFFDLPNLTLLSGKESYALDRDDSPKVIISSSGMVQGGHIIHHMQTYLAKKNATILFVGYQGEDTMGRKIQCEEKPIILGRERVRVRAKIQTIEGFSGHADREDLRRWMDSSPGIGQILLTHGEPDVIEAFEENLVESGARASALVEGVPFEII